MVTARMLSSTWLPLAIRDICVTIGEFSFRMKTVFAILPLELYVMFKSFDDFKIR